MYYYFSNFNKFLTLILQKNIPYIYNGKKLKVKTYKYIVLVFQLITHDMLLSYHTAIIEVLSDLENF